MTKSAINIKSGDLVSVGMVTNVAFHPSAFFLAYRVGGGPVSTREFDLDYLNERAVTVTVRPDCTTLDVAS